LDGNTVPVAFGATSFRIVGIVLDAADDFAARVDDFGTAGCGCVRANADEIRVVGETCE
jgi:hypothetical protein